MADPVGGVRTLTLDGDGYVVATAARGSAVVMAGVPVAEADAGVRRLLDAMLIVVPDRPSARHRGRVAGSPGGRYGRSRGSPSAPRG